MFGQLSAKSKLSIAVVVSLAICLLIVWLVNFATFDLSARLLAEAAQIAMAVAPAELPDDNNAAVAYSEAMHELGEATWSKRQTDRWINDWDGGIDTPLDPKDLELRDFLAERAGGLEQLRKAGKKPGCRFPRDVGRPTINNAVSEISKLRDGVRMLRLNARFQAANGNSTAALEDCRAIFAMAEQLASDPFSQTLMFAASFNGVGFATLEEVLNASPIAAESLTDVFRSPDFSFTQALLQSTKMDEACGLVAFADIADGRQPVSTLAPGLAQTASSRFYCWVQLPGDLELFRDASKRTQQLAGKPQYEIQEQLAAADDAIDRRAGRFTKLSRSGLRKWQDFISRADAYRRLARLGLATHRFQRVHSRLPNELSELIPDFVDAIPLDPFDGKPLRMIKTDSGLVLYSVGDDLRDNGGVLSYIIPEPTDIPFHVRDFGDESKSK